MLSKTVAVVGCGPVGMFASHLLSHFNIDYQTFERFESPRAHPSAHWISSSSKLLLSQIPGLAQSIEAKQQNWHNFQYYRYSQGVFGYQLGSTDHFDGNIKARLTNSKEYFNHEPTHMPQNRLLQIMYSHMDGQMRNKNLRFSQCIESIKQTTGQDGSRYTLYNDKNSPVLQAKYVILCSGINTKLRDPHFTLKGNQELMDVINIHFRSKALAKQLTDRNRNAMLHFVYGTKIIGILVNHSIEEGIFVLQIPNFEPVLDLITLYSGREMIQMSLGIQNSSILNDIKVIHIGKWKLQGILANKMNHNRILLAGDSAHAFPPAGGFGMNSGFQDVSEAVHSIRCLEKNPKLDYKQIFSLFNENRRGVNSRYLSKALENLEVTKQVARKLGYPSYIKDYFISNLIAKSLSSFLPQSAGPQIQNTRLKTMEFIYKRKDLGSPKLHLFFDDFDLQAQRPSKIRNQIFKETCKSKPKSLWVRKDVSREEIIDKLGEIQDQQLMYYDNNKEEYRSGQRIVGSSGVVILE